MRYWKDHASYPFQSHDLWFLTENIRWGYLPPNLDTKALIAKVNREDLWRAAAKELGVAAKDIPDLHLARRREVLRRQGVRPGQPEEVPRQPDDQEHQVPPEASAVA